eukprot:2556024-Pleurochrysis_carterae.AAC.1
MRVGRAARVVKSVSASADGIESGAAGASCVSPASIAVKPSNAAVSHSTSGTDACEACSPVLTKHAAMSPMVCQASLAACCCRAELVSPCPSLRATKAPLSEADAKACAAAPGTPTAKSAATSVTTPAAKTE